MCMFSAPKPVQDNSAQIAAAREAQRQADIAAGRSRIDEAFTQFDDPYYQGIQTAYLDNYNPQIEGQYNDAMRKLKLSLARTGNLNAGAGARKIGDLTEAYQTQRGAIAGQALDAMNKQRSAIEGARTELYSQNNQAADPAAAAASAAARVGSLAAPQGYSPLGDLFASVINNAATNVRAEGAGLPGYRTGLFTPPKGGYAQIVN